MLRSLRLDPVLIQALIAGALSFAHLHDLAEAAGQHGWKAWAYPVSVDLLLVAAWRRMRTLRAGGDSAHAAWVWFIIALAASLGANVATAGLLDMNHIPAVLRIIVAGWPALAFLGGTLLAHTPTPPPTHRRPGPTRHRPIRNRSLTSPWTAPRSLPPNSPHPYPRPSLSPRCPQCRCLRPWWSTPARSPTPTARQPVPRSTPTPCAPASVSPPRWPTPSPPNSPERSTP